MEKVRLIGINSICEMTKEGWQEKYNVKVDVNGKKYMFKSDLKNGVKKETEKFFSAKNYDYSCFEAMYGRVSKEIKNMYGKED